MLRHLHAILLLITNMQQASEVDLAYIGYVTKQWIEIKAEWQRMEASGAHNIIDFNELRVLYQARFSKQVGPLHFLAWCLHPSTAQPAGHIDAVPLTDQLHRQIIGILREHTNPVDHATVQNEWISYRARHGNLLFDQGSIFWDFAETPLNAWRYAITQGSKLAPIALRILGCIANSVPSERSFSALNYIHSSVRNRLKPDNADKQVFVFMNSRVLERIERGHQNQGRFREGPLPDWLPQEDQLVQIEDELIEQQDILEGLDEEQGVGDDGGGPL